MWEDVLAAEPAPVRRVGGVALDRALAAVGDFADLRSRWTRGRSTRLAETARAAGRACGLPAADVVTLGRAALVADLGGVGVPTGVWERPGPLGVEDTERVRLHPYLSERVLGRCAGLRPVSALAGAHHERLDGSGYHRGSTAAQLARPARLLAAADVWTALGEDRPHRAAYPPAEARDVLWAEVTAGRLDGVAAEAVLAVGGHGDARHRSPRPAGLTEREVEVLRLIARGSRTGRGRQPVDLAEDGRASRRAHLRQDRRHDATRGGAVRDGARPAARIGRSPDAAHRPPGSRFLHPEEGEHDE